MAHKPGQADRKGKPKGSNGGDTHLLCFVLDPSPAYMTLEHLTNTALRLAIQANTVSFPSQVPVFAKQSAGHLERRIVQLYFVRNWPIEDIAKRYGINKERARQVLINWKIRAISSGYIQELEPESPTAVNVDSGDPKPTEEFRALMPAIIPNADPSLEIIQTQRAPIVTDKRSPAFAASGSSMMGQR
jgi:hypothetical protein